MPKDIDLCALFVHREDGYFMLHERVGDIIFLDRKRVDHFVDNSLYFCIPMNLSDKVYSDILGEEDTISNMLERGVFREVLRQKRIKEGVTKDDKA